MTDKRQTYDTKANAFETLASPVFAFDDSYET